jgi:hypothetical protein
VDRRSTPFVASSVVLALVAALIALPTGTAAGDEVVPAPDVVIVCPELFIFVPDPDDVESDGLSLAAVPQGALVVVFASLNIFGFTTADAPTDGFDGCETFTDPTVLEDLQQDEDRLFFDGGVVELKIEFDGDSLPWTDLSEELDLDVFFGEPEDPDAEPDLVWTLGDEDKDGDTVLSADLEDFLSGSQPESVRTVASGFQFGPLFMTLKGDTALGDYTVTATFTLNPAAGEDIVLTASSTFTVVVPQAPASGPGATVSCTAPVVGAVVTCDLRSDPGVEFLWQASTNPVFASGVVTTDATGAGQFVFTTPASALGQPVLVEIVAWTAATPIGVAAGPIPTSVPSGGGPRSPVDVALVLGIAVLGAVALVRPATRRSADAGIG